MLIILETGHAEAAYNLRNRMARDLLQTDAAVGYFSRRTIPLMRRLRSRNMLPPNIQQIMVANLIREALVAVNTGSPWTRQDTSHADNT